MLTLVYIEKVKESMWFYKQVEMVSGIMLFFNIELFFRKKKEKCYEL